MRATSQRKEFPTKTCNLYPAPCRLSSILTSWDEDDRHKNKEKLPYPRKNETNKTSIFLKSIFNLPLKNNYFKEKLTSNTFEKYDPTSCISKGTTFRDKFDKSHGSTFTQVTNSPPACMPACLKLPCSSSSEPF